MIDDIKDMTPAEAVIALRNAYGMTRREFCEYFDIPPRTLQNWEYGERTPAKFTITAICKCYDMEQENKRLLAHMEQENARLREYIDLLNRQNEELKSVATVSLRGEK